MAMKIPELMRAWRKFRDGDHLTDAELAGLLVSMEAALPLLESMPEAGAVRRVVFMDRDEIRRYQRARQ